MRSRSVAIVVFEGVQALDVLGPADVFYFANHVLGGVAYEIELVGPSVGQVTTASGPRLVVDREIHDPGLRPDVLLVAGGLATLAAAEDEGFVAALRELAGRSEEIGSVCIGALLLAETGLLDGRTATTHWALADQLRRRHPRVDVDANRIFAHDGVWTSAGVTAGIDLALELVRTHHGTRVAAAAAKNMVVYLQRAGGQDQFSMHLAAQETGGTAMSDLMAHVADHPEEDLSVRALAARLHMSERSFQRAFTREVGTSPARYVERCRIDAVRRLLEQTDDGLQGIARQTGVRSAATLIRSFERIVGVTPTEYRARFTRPPADGR
ncbi:MAG: DJ-1/PfpI family protein [Thermoleophilia bacterium]